MAILQKKYNMKTNKCPLCVGCNHKFTLDVGKSLYGKLNIIWFKVWLCQTWPKRKNEKSIDYYYKN